MVCLITGSSRGLGKAVALAFGKRGHRVAVHYKDKKSEAGKVFSGNIIIGEDLIRFEI